MSIAARDRAAWTSARTYRNAFDSNSVQHSIIATASDSPSFLRTGARVLGPGSYDLDHLVGWLHDPEVPGSSFKSKSPLRTRPPKRFDIELGRDGGVNAARKKCGLQLGSAPGTYGQRWSTSPRWRGGHKREPGQDSTYDHKGILRPTASRAYANAFRRGANESRVEKVDMSARRGPGLYNWADAKTGIQLLDPIRPSTCFAPRVGGKFAHVAASDLYAF